MTLHRWRNLKMQDKRFRNVIHKSPLNDGAIILLDKQRIGDELVLVVHAYAANIGAHVLVLHRNKLTRCSFDYEVHVSLQTKCMTILLVGKSLYGATENPQVTEIES